MVSEFYHNKAVFKTGGGAENPKDLNEKIHKPSYRYFFLLSKQHLTHGKRNALKYKLKKTMIPFSLRLVQIF